MRSDPTQRFVLLAAATLLVLPAFFPTSAAAASDEADSRARAIAAYDSGDCATAMPLLVQIDTAGQADGALLYRLYYCQREAGESAARDTAGRAREALEQEFEVQPTLETGFYLSNAYRNAGRVTSATEVATAVTTRIEADEAPGPATPMETFQLAKLYAEQNNTDRAGQLYAESLDGLLVPNEPASPAAQWATRYLAERAWTEQNWSDVARYYAMLAPGDRNGEDLDRLAMALVRQRSYREAAKIWFDALRLNPAGGDRARYCAQLATQAAEVAPLPELAPDGREWSELAGEDLGQILLDKATFANSQLQAVAADPDAFSKEQREALREQLQAARAEFVRAGLEATLRGIPLRETAFQSGYAPLVFHRSRWDLPVPKPKPWKRVKPEPKADPPAGESEGS